jgi:hypothetical protein
MVRESGGIATAIALQIPCQNDTSSSHYSALNLLRCAPLGLGDNFLSGEVGQLETSFSTAGWSSIADLLTGHQLATSSPGCALPTPLLLPLYHLPHHRRPPSARSRACSGRSPARHVHAPAPCCQPELPTTTPDEPSPPHAVSSTPRAIGRARALACLVRVFWRGEFCSRSPGRHCFSLRPLAGTPTASTSPASIGRARSWRRRAASGRQGRERRSASTSHAAHDGVPRRERGAILAPRLVDELGSPPTRLYDACHAFADELRACTVLYHVLYVLSRPLVCGGVVHDGWYPTSSDVLAIGLLSALCRSLRASLASNMILS